MTNLETSRSEEVLTDSKPVQERQPESTEPDKIDVPEDAKNFQHALQKAREREKQLMEQLRVKEEAEKQKKLADMSETERYKTLADEESQKRARLELKIAVQEILAGKNLPAGIKDLLNKSPWAIPAVQDELGVSFTWDEAIESVKKHLPAYVDSLTVNTDKAELEEEPSIKKVDSERSVDAAVVKEHIYTKSEVEKLSKDPADYEKHRDRILRQMAKHGGVLPM